MTNVMENKRLLYRVGAGVLVLLLVIQAIVDGSTRYDSFRYPPDAYTYVRMSIEVANGYPVLQTADPPLRYLPFSTVIRVFDVPDAQVPVVIATMVAFGSVVVVPLLLSAIAKILAGRTAALGTLCLLSLDRIVFGWTTTTFNGGSMFQTDQVVVFCLLALLCVTVGVGEENGRRGWVWLVGGGVCLGMAALTQLANAGFAAFLVALVLAYHRRFRALAVVAGVSILVSAPMLLMPNLIENTAVHVGRPRRNPMDPTVPGFWRFAAVLSGELRWLLVAALPIGLGALRGRESDRLLLEGVALVAMVIVPGCLLLGLGYYEYATRTLVDGLVMMAAVVSLVEVSRLVSDTIPAISPNSV